jgi:pimeloyl-ACP methyl ester carboxylesterase
MALLLVLSALSGVQDSREERGRYTLRCFGREAGTEEYRLEEFEEGNVVLFSKARWSVDVLGEKRDFQVDAVLTMDKAFAPVRYAGYHKSGKQEELSKVEWQKGQAVPDRKKPVKTAAPFVLDHNAFSQLLPIVRRLDGRKKILVFRPGPLADAELSAADRGQTLLRGPDGEIPVRERVLSIGPLVLTVHVDAKGRVLRAWNPLQGTLAELEGFEGWIPAPPAAPPAAVEEQPVLLQKGRARATGELSRTGDAKGRRAALLLGSADVQRAVADALAAAGFVVLRLDERAPDDGSMDDLVADAQAGVEQLRARGDVASVSVVGHDEGALTACLLAARDASVRPLVLLSAPGRPLDAILLEAAERELRAQKTAEPVIAAMLEKERRTFDLVRGSTEDALEIDERRTYVARLRDRLNLDPAEALKKAAVPVTLFRGARDPRPDAGILKAAKPDADLKVFEGLDRNFRGAGGAVPQGFLKALADTLRADKP